MRNALLSIMVVPLLLSLAVTHSRSVASPARVPEQRWDSYVGKYPSDLLKGVPSLKPRLRTLLGANYSMFMERLQVERPIEKVEGALVGRGCMAHSCGVEEAIMAINLADGKLHCAILSDKFGGKFKVFSEDSDHVPAGLTKAMEQPK
jgi:hypothetical protein